MRILFFLLVISTSVLGAEVPYEPSYEIQKSTTDAKIAKGKYVVEGIVYHRSSGELVSGAKVVVGKTVTKTDGKGKFKVYLSTDKKHFVLTKIGFAELCIPNFKTQSQTRFVVAFYLDKENETQPMNVKKPVLYFYNNDTAQVNISFLLKAQGELTFAYPSFNRDSLNGWNLQLKGKELKLNGSKQNYPYLFWESKQQNIYFKHTVIPPAHRRLEAQYSLEGFLVKKQDVVPFLDSVLTLVGFNSTEKTDFITFWAPQMLESEQYLIQFAQNEDCENFAEYEIVPKPKAINRFYMLFESRNGTSNIEVKPQVLHVFDRNGFYLVDWGGVDLSDRKRISDL